MKQPSFSQVVDLFIETLQEELKKEKKLSKNIISKLRTARGLMANLCPETDGLQQKNRLKFTPVGNNDAEKEQWILDISYSLLSLEETGMSKKNARNISLICDFKGYTSYEIRIILIREYYRNQKC